jgi:hypothetical protein
MLLLDFSLLFHFLCILYLSLLIFGFTLVYTTGMIGSDSINIDYLSV